MEDKLQVKPHTFKLDERKNLYMTGILDVQSFDPEEVVLESTEGNLILKGTELHVKRLNLEKGELDIEGDFNSIVYAQGKIRGRKKGESFISHLFS